MRGMRSCKRMKPRELVRFHLRPLATRHPMAEQPRNVKGCLVPLSIVRPSNSWRHLYSSRLALWLRWWKPTCTRLVEGACSLQHRRRKCRVLKTRWALWAVYAGFVRNSMLINEPSKASVIKEKTSLVRFGRWCSNGGREEEEDCLYMKNRDWMNYGTGTLRCCKIGFRGEIFRNTWKFFFKCA